jgi:hypothetical protein
LNLASTQIVVSHKNITHLQGLVKFGPAAEAWFLLPILLYAFILLGVAWRKAMAAFMTVATLLPGLIILIIAHFLNDNHVVRHFVQLCNIE